MEPEQEIKKKSPAGLIIAIILLLAALGALGYFGYNFYSEEVTKQELWEATAKARITPLPTSMVPTPEPTPEVPEEPTPTPVPTIAPEDMLPNDNLQSAFACMIRKSDGQALLNKNMDDRMYPASMVKILTTIVALENLPDLLMEVQVLQQDIDPGYLAGASMAGFSAFETVRVLDLLFGAMLPSGADACLTLARAVSGSEAAFVELMNEKAIEIGLQGSHFTNVTGLHDENQYTTCHDMAILMQYCMENTDFRNIVATSVFTTIPTELHPQGITLYSTVYEGFAETTFANGAVFLGGKTGTTEEAGRCLVSAATFYGEEYYLVTAMARGETPGNFEDTALIYSELTR